jgi:hypothetical protein
MILKINSLGFLWNESNECGIKAFFKLSTSMKVMEQPHDVYLNHISASLEESRRKTIKTWSLNLVHTFHHL